jgi:hypothetical protein
VSNMFDTFEVSVTDTFGNVCTDMTGLKATISIEPEEDMSHVPDLTGVTTVAVIHGKAKFGKIEIGSGKSGPYSLKIMVPGIPTKNILFFFRNPSDVRESDKVAKEIVRLKQQMSSNNMKIRQLSDERDISDKGSESVKSKIQSLKDTIKTKFDVTDDILSDIPTFIQSTQHHLDQLHTTQSRAPRLGGLKKDSSVFEILAEKAKFGQDKSGIIGSVFELIYVENEYEAGVLASKVFGRNFHAILFHSKEVGRMCRE